MVGFAFCFKPIATEFGKISLVALLPITICTFLGVWALAIDSWRARIGITMRAESRFLWLASGQFRALILSTAFSVLSVSVLAWLAIKASILNVSIILALVFVAGSVFLVFERILIRHFYQPFARTIAVFIASILSAVPFFLLIAYGAWAWDVYPGALQTATFGEAVQIGLDETPKNLGMLSALLSVPFAYDAAKVWAVVQLRDYPIVAALFSFDAAIFSFVMARTGIVATIFVQSHLKEVIVHAD